MTKFGLVSVLRLNWPNAATVAVLTLSNIKDLAAIALTLTSITITILAYRRDNRRRENELGHRSDSFKDRA